MLEKNHKILIIAGASIPWRTGYAINPLYRAAEFARQGYDCTLLLPWITDIHQDRIFNKNEIFHYPEEQTYYIQKELERKGLTVPNIDYFPAVLIGGKQFFLRFILALDVYHDFDKYDTIICEEAGQILFAAAGVAERIKESKARSVNIYHTNYAQYLKIGTSRLSLISFFVENILRRAFTIGTSNFDKSVLLSETLRVDYYDIGFEEARDPVHAVSNVNGVDVASLSKSKPSGDKFYFLGRLSQEKGFFELIELMSKSNLSGIDIYGDGDFKEEIEKEATIKNVTLNFKGYFSGDYSKLTNYKTLINCSKTEVLCTVTAEAVGAGKFVILPDHPSNYFFKQFKNAYFYTDQKSFNDAIDFCNSNHPVEDPALKELSWESACKRLLKTLS